MEVDGPVVALAEDGESSSVSLATDLATAQDVLMWVLCIAFALTFLCTLSVAVFHIAKRPGWNVKKVLFCLVPWPVFFRLIDMATQFNDDYLTSSLEYGRLAALSPFALPAFPCLPNPLAAAAAAAAAALIIA